MKDEQRKKRRETEEVWKDAVDVEKENCSCTNSCSISSFSIAAVIVVVVVVSNVGGLEFKILVNHLKS